jgi:hypothetical protein
MTVRRVLRQNWAIAILLAAGLVLRVLAQVAYRPALLYIDTMKYLYNAYPGADPVGYKVPLKLILAVGNLGTVTAVQHLLGLVMALVIYLLLIRYGIPRWLAALATAPVLLDAYQVQIEQNIMPDVWFEALIVAGIAVLVWSAALRPGAGGAALAGAGSAQAGTAAGASSSAPARSGPVARLARRLPAGLIVVVVAGLLLGATATFRQVGEILIIPALLYLVAVGGGWQTVLTRLIAFTVAFAIPIGAYMSGSLFVSGHLWLDNATPSLNSYGRMATAADCATLKIPNYERPLCPTPHQRAYGIDWLDHDTASPLKTYTPPAGLNRYAVISSFDHQVLLQQPLRVLTAIASDGATLFAPGRTATQDGTPISRWQFQDYYPSYGSWVMVSRAGVISFGLRLVAASPVITHHVLDASYGGKAQVNKPIASFLRSYQRGGGYTPGPLMALLALAGLCGSVLCLARRASAARRQLAVACLLFFGTGLAVLAISDAFQFSWRYQLPALVTLPPAGVLGIMAIASYFGKPRSAAASGSHDEVPELASPAV